MVDDDAVLNEDPPEGGNDSDESEVEERESPGVAATGLRVAAAGSGRIARPFAWAAGIAITVANFLNHAIPKTQLKIVEPFLDYKWVEIEHTLTIDPAEPFVGPLTVAISVLLLAWLVLRWVDVRGARKASMVVDDEAVRIRYARSWPRTKEVPLSSIAAAQAPSGGELVIHLHTGSKLTVATPRAEELAATIEERRSAAAAIPAGLGWHAIPLGGAMRWIWALGGVTVLSGIAKAAGEAAARGSFGAGVLAGLLMLLWLVVGYTLSSRTTVVVGTDGVRVTHPWRTQFVPYHLVDDVVTKAGVVRLVRKDGRDFFISSKNTERLMKDIREALDRYHNPEASGVEHHLDELSRGERSTERWRDDLERLLEQQDYRGPKLGVDDLVHLVGDGQADPEQRVAAALALPKDDVTKKRIRIAAEQSADEDTRAAIAAAAEDEVAADQLERAAQRYRQG